MAPQNVYHQAQNDRKTHESDYLLLKSNHPFPQKMRFELNPQYGLRSHHQLLQKHDQ